jgi:hypothetical protein
VADDDIDRVRKIIKIKETKSIKTTDKKNGVKYVIRETPLLPAVENIQFPLPKISISRFTQCLRNACKVLGIKITPHDL